MITSRNPRGGEPRAAVVAEQVVFDDYTFEVAANDGGWDWYVYRRSGELVGRGFRSTRPEAMHSAKMSIGQRRRRGGPPLTPSQIHRQAMLAAALVAAGVRDEAEGGDEPPLPREPRFRQGWYQAADKIARALLELTDTPPKTERST